MLLGSEEFSADLVQSLKTANREVIIFSAFIKVDALKYLAEQTQLESSKDVLIVARWQKRDLLAGASDLEVYNYCQAKGWRFGISLQMHGKLFCIDEKEIFLGSANLTRRGLHIGLVGNHEFGTKISAETADMKKLNSFIYSEVRLVDDMLFEAISQEVEIDKSNHLDILAASWSNQISMKIDRPVKFLWVKELPKAKPVSILALRVNDDTVAADCELFGIDFDRVCKAELVSCFKMSRVYRWLLEQLHINETLYFGGVTSALHNALLDDPKPYRVEVKDAVANLYAWAEMCDDTFIISRPGHSQLLTLKGD